MSLMSAYLDLITSQHRDKPKFMATVEAVLQPSNDIFECAIYMDDFFDLDEAEGAQEDVLGQIVGQSRQMPFELVTTGKSVLDNETYRTMIKAKIAKNLWKGGIADLEDTWENLFGNRIKIKDNQDMTIEVQITDVPTTAVQELILRGQVVPKPQSVGIKYNVIRELQGIIYQGGSLSVYKEYTVGMAKPGNQSAEITMNAGGVLSEYHEYTVGMEKPGNQSAAITMNAGGMLSRYYEYTVGLRPPQNSDAAALRYTRGAVSRYKEFLVSPKED
ncbi:MAG: DUF2612 domain-containing protein [Selenomonas sp.]|nr:DUF2612 domain-containing protein [Selenomonas sp.]